MRKKKFTAGPWECNPEQEQMVLAKPPKGWGATPEHPRYIVTQTSIYTSPEQITSLYNANLISAAPELLEALEESTELIRGIIENLDAPKADVFILRNLNIIAKAYGETK